METKTFSTSLLKLSLLQCFSFISSGSISDLPQFILMLDIKNSFRMRVEEDADLRARTGMYAAIRTACNLQAGISH